MAEGKINDHGIWEFGEDDRASLVSTLLNKLGGSITTVVANLKSRLTTLEESAPVTVATGRYNLTMTNVANAASTAFGTPVIDAAGSSTVAGTLWTPFAGGLRFIRKGIYSVTVRVTATALLGGRCFVGIGPGETTWNNRLSFTPSGEDVFVLSMATLVVPTDNLNVGFAFFHSSGAARTAAMRIDVTRTGALT